MYRSCQNLLVRKKQNKPYFFCKYKSNIISLKECENCLERIFTRNKPIKKKSNKKITVTKETYQKVFERDKGKCRLLDETCNGKLELHHIKYRSEAKELINDVNNCIMLCNRHHRLVHSNKHYWQPILKEMIKSG